MLEIYLYVALYVTCGSEIPVLVFTQLILYFFMYLQLEYHFLHKISAQLSPCFITDR